MNAPLSTQKSEAQRQGEEKPWRVPLVGYLRPAVLWVGWSTSDSHPLKRREVGPTEVKACRHIMVSRVGLTNLQLFGEGIVNGGWENLSPERESMG